MPTPPIMLVSCGDPSGVGPELIVGSFAKESVRNMAANVLVGPVSIWERAAVIAGVSMPNILENPSQILSMRMGDTMVLDLPSSMIPEFNIENDIVLGTPSELTGTIAFQVIDYCVQLMIEGVSEILVTAPLSKHAVSLTQPGFVGHTGFIGDKFNVTPLMMLEGGGLRVAVATGHIPLKDVPAAITRERVAKEIQRLSDSLKSDYNIDAPRIGVCGLNPHAGEGGLLGDEEIIEIIPAINDARNAGVHAFGPIPGDTAPVEMLNGKFDAILAMYHDQGLAAMKAVGFWEGVNVTLGLPVVRTSPDHGTAFDMAGTGQANATPTIRAVHRAVAIWRHRNA